MSAPGVARRDPRAFDQSARRRRPRARARRCARRARPRGGGPCAGPARAAGSSAKTACRDRIGRRRAPVGTDLREMVETRVADYVAHFERRENRGFDVYHAQDGLSGAALATLKDAGLIAGFARTIHHVDVFADPHRRRDADALDRFGRRLFRRQREMAPRWLSDAFRNRLDNRRQRRRRRALRARKDGSDDALRARLPHRPGPVVLAVGGVEPRKNTMRLLRAFAALREASSGRAAGDRGRRLAARPRRISPRARPRRGRAGSARRAP